MITFCGWIQTLVPVFLGSNNSKVQANVFVFILKAR